jgi:hypothetical protein
VDEAALQAASLFFDDRCRFSALAGMEQKIQLSSTTTPSRMVTRRSI